MINLTNEFQEQLNAKVAKAQEAKSAEQLDSRLAMLENHNFIEAQRVISAKQNELQSLSTTITQLNSIKPHLAKDGSRFNINVYPVGIFGTGMAEVLGIITGSRSAFTDELALQYSALTNLSIVELAEARDALGSPAYFSKGEIVPAIPGSYDQFKPLLESICMKLGLYEYSAESVTRDRVELWFTRSELTANTKATEHNKSEAINDTESLVIED